MERNDPVRARRLNGVDAAFIYLEREELPLSIAAVCVFDGPISLKDLVRRVDSKLHLLPRLRQIVVPPPFNIGYPAWEDDPKFDIRDHVFRTNVDEPGGEAELEELGGRIFSGVMDRNKPLWDFHVVDGLKGGRGALIVRMHHSLADGVSGAAVLTTILDPTREGSLAMRKPRVRTPREPAPKPTLAGALVNAIHSSLDHLIGAQVGIMEIGRALAAEGAALVGMASLLPEMVGAVERLPFNKRCGAGRKFCWAEIDLSRALAVRAAAGGSVNDVILTVLTRAIARYTQLHGETVANRLIRIVCPVNMRRPQDGRPGNQLAFMPVVLPMGVENPVRMLQQVATRTAAMKKARTADLVSLAARCLGIAPPAVQAMLWQGISHVMFPLPLFNTICTNIPGPTEPLYCVGRKMVACYPQVPTGYELGINSAVLSYAGKLYFGLTADAQVAPDVTRLRDFLCPVFEELCAAAGVKTAPARATSSRKAPLRKTTSRKQELRRAKPAAAGPVAEAAHETPVEQDAASSAVTKQRRRAKPAAATDSAATPVAEAEPETFVEQAAALSAVSA